MTPKGGAKAPKWKNDAKDNRPPKKGMGPSVGDEQQKSSSPLPPRHCTGKGLKTGKGPITLDPIQRLVTHKDYVVEMVNLIIKETDLHPYGEHSSEDLGASSLYDLFKVCSLSFIIL